MKNIQESQQQTLNVARQKAKRSQLTSHQPQQQGLTSYNDLIGNYTISFITTASGNTYKIQKIDPGMYMSITGSPLIQILNNADIDLTDSNAVEETIKNLSTEDKLDYVQSDEFLLFMQRIVCAGVVSLNLVCKHQDNCSPTRKELSIDLLPANDLIEIYNAIMDISVPEGEREVGENFRSDSEAEQDETDTDISDSAKI